jgi:hypothetical protein
VEEEPAFGTSRTLGLRQDQSRQLGVVEAARLYFADFAVQVMRGSV